MADDGLARAIKPAHGTGDGDTIFALATATDPRTNINLNQIGNAAADALSRAIVRAIINADSIHIGTCNVASYCEQFPANCTP
jgi:L-aminopeptidase/D-esterase-like protein